eukprot:g8923.t1
MSSNNPPGRMLPPALRSKGKGKGKVRPAPAAANGASSGERERLLPPDDDTSGRHNSAAASRRRRPNAEDSDEEKERESTRKFNPFGVEGGGKSEKLDFQDADAYNYEDIRNERFNARRRREDAVKDTVGEGEGVREEAPVMEREADHGYRLEAFNLDREMEEGRFDDQEGAFVFDKVEELKQVTDRWLDEVDKGTKEAKMSEKDIRLIREKQSDKSEEGRKKAPLELGELKRELCLLLGTPANPNETPADGMRRLNREATARDQARGLAVGTGAAASSSSAPGGAGGARKKELLLPHERKRRKLEKERAKAAGGTTAAANGTTAPTPLAEGAATGAKRVYDPVWGTWTSSAPAQITGKSPANINAPAAADEYAPGQKKRVLPQLMARPDGSITIHCSHGLAVTCSLYPAPAYSSSARASCLYPPQWGISETARRFAPGGSKRLDRQSPPSAIRHPREPITQHLPLAHLPSGPTIQLPEQAVQASRIAELCNLLLADGFFDIYDTKKEIILPPDEAAHYEQQQKQKAANAKRQTDELMKDFLEDDEDELEEAGDGATVGVGALEGAGAPGPTAVPAAAAAAAPAGAAPEAPRGPPTAAAGTTPSFWQYEMNGQLYGPFPSAQMQAWAPILKGKGLKVREMMAMGSASGGGGAAADGVARGTDAGGGGAWKVYDEVDFG